MISYFNKFPFKYYNFRRSEMTDETNVTIEDEIESKASAANVQKADDETAEIDPFFGTGHFSIHHQPEHDDDPYIGE